MDTGGWEFSWNQKKKKTQQPKPFDKKTDYSNGKRVGATQFFPPSNYAKVQEKA